MNDDRVLLENNFDRDNACHMAIKVFRSTFTTPMCKCTIITLLDNSNLNAFQTFWPRLNILRLVDVPKIIDDCNFRSADSRVSLSNFSFNKVYERCARHVTSHLLLSLPNQLPVVFVKSNIIISKSEFNETIILFALVGYEIGYSQLCPTGLFGYLPSHIQQARME